MARRMEPEKAKKGMTCGHWRGQLFADEPHGEVSDARGDPSSMSWNGIDHHATIRRSDVPLRVNFMIANENQSLEAAPCWGDFEIEVNGRLERQIGSLSIGVHRLKSEWQVVTDAYTGIPRTDGPPSPRRFVFKETRGPLHLRPALADRPVITRPLAPVQIAARESVTIYVSTPVLIQIAVDDPPVLLEETFVIQPSDTWFGSSTREGELCYASSTSARLEVSALPVRPERALTSVRIDNQSTDHLLLERIALPTPYLRLFKLPSGALWTQDISFTHESAGELAELILADAPFLQAPDGVLVCEPRVPAETRTLYRAFGAMFS